VWVQIFSDCTEWHTDGGQYKKGKSKKVVLTGFQTIREWPAPGGIMNQENITVEVFNTLLNEQAQTYARNLKLG